MKTSDLIRALAADAPAQAISIPRRALAAMALGGLLSLAIFLAAVGPRADLAHAVQTIRFQMKYLDALALAAPALALCWRLSRPDGDPGILVAGLVAPFALLALSVGVELAVVPSDFWMTRLVGSNLLHCLVFIPLLSMPPLAALMYVLRDGAPSHPALTGALAGAASAGLSAMIYATNCTDDSPLFVAAWYPVATSVVVGVGALAGRRLLRW